MPEPSIPALSSGWIIVLGFLIVLAGIMVRRHHRHCRAEVDEKTCCKDFTPSERVAAASLKPDSERLPTILERDLGTKIRSIDQRRFDDVLPPFTPVDPVTGAPGWTVVIKRLEFDEANDQIRILPSLVRFVGNERRCTEYVPIYRWLVCNHVQVVNTCIVAKAGSEESTCATNA